MKVTQDTTVAPTQAPIASARQIAGIRSSATGISGVAVRRSCRSSRNSDAAASPTSPATPGTAAAEMRCPCSSAISSGTTKPENKTSPSQSNRKCPRGGARSGSRTASTAASRPSGTLIRNTDCHPRCCVSQPPATGPKVEEVMKMEAR